MRQLRYLEEQSGAAAPMPSRSEFIVALARQIESTVANAREL